MEEFIKKLRELNDSKNEQDANNIFKILKVDDVEIRHSNFLAWLLDAKHNFYIKDKFLKGFLKIANINTTEEDFEKIEVTREENNIDLIIRLKNSIIVIENKIWALEDPKQLENYYQKIISTDYPNKYFIFLDMKGLKPQKESDRIVWQSMNYNQILDVLRDVSKQKYTEEIDLLLKNYIEVLEEKTMQKDNNYWKQCIQISKEYKQIIEDINIFVPNYERRAKIIKDFCQKYGTLSKGKNLTYINFYPFAFEEVFKSKELGEHFIYIQFSNNDSSLPCVTFYFGATDKVNKMNMAPFYYMVNKKNIKDCNQDRSLGLSSTKLIDEKIGTKTEEECCAQLQESLEKFINDPASKFNEVLDLIKNYSPIYK